MKQFKPISTLIFDFGGVLINLNLPACIQNIKNLGIEDIDKYLSIYGQLDFFLKYEKGEISIPEFRNEIRSLSSLNPTDQEIDDAWCSFVCDIPHEKFELLTKLRKRFKLLLLSNTNPLHIERNAKNEFAKVGKTMDDFFDKCYLSYQMGMAKPNPDIFHALLKDANVSPEECLFLDDAPKNIETANKLGIQTYLVDINENLDFLLNLEVKTN